MRPQRKRMIVETTRAFVKLKQNKAAVSAGGTKFVTPQANTERALKLLGLASAGSAAVSAVGDLPSNSR